MIAKPHGSGDTVNAAVAYMDVGKGREQDAEALCTDSSWSYPGRSAWQATVIHYPAWPLVTQAWHSGVITRNERIR